MLFIYGSLPVGGIETFFVRMAKERSRLGLPTSVLLLSGVEISDAKLLQELQKYADVYFLDDVYVTVPFFTQRFPLLAPLKKKALRQYFASVDHIHVTDAMHALVAQRLLRALGKNAPISVGVYHYIKYLWGGDKVAEYEKINRKFVFEYLPKALLLLFSDGNRELYEKHKNIDLSACQTFRLGVVDKKVLKMEGEMRPPLHMVAVGRLVEFKTYNFYMLDVIKDLGEKGFQVHFDIYGDGPLRQELECKITERGLQDQVRLKGTLDYLQFDEVVAKYDIFIGSGTAIIQAASLGVPSIVGVENFAKPLTYGYFCDVYQHEYNVKGLELPLLSVEALLERYITMESAQRMMLKKRHQEAIEGFTNQSCQNSLDELKNIPMPQKRFKFSLIRYEVSRTLDWITMKLKKTHPRLNRYDEFKNLNEKQ